MAENFNEPVIHFKNGAEIYMLLGHRLNLVVRRWNTKQTVRDRIRLVRQFEVIARAVFRARAS